MLTSVLTVYNSQVCTTKVVMIIMIRMIIMIMIIIITNGVRHSKHRPTPRYWLTRAARLAVKITVQDMFNTLYLIAENWIERLLKNCVVFMSWFCTERQMGHFSLRISQSVPCVVPSLNLIQRFVLESCAWITECLKNFLELFRWIYLASFSSYVSKLRRQIFLKIFLRSF